MGTRRSMSDEQRQAAVALFASGQSRRAVATQLGVSPGAIRALQQRWQIWGDAALVGKPTKQTYAFDVKHEIVHRALAGETKLALAQEYGLSSPQLIAKWLRVYRADGDDGLRPKPHGRPKQDAVIPAGDDGELAQLRRENARLRVEVAYLEKLRALIATERR